VTPTAARRASERALQPGLVLVDLPVEDGEDGLDADVDVPELLLDLAEPAFNVPEPGLYIPEPGLYIPEPGLYIPEPGLNGPEALRVLALRVVHCLQQGALGALLGLDVGNVLFHGGSQGCLGLNGPFKGTEARVELVLSRLEQVLSRPQLVQAF
jgi:hypothetical protein